MEPPFSIFLGFSVVILALSLINVINRNRASKTVAISKILVAPLFISHALCLFYWNMYLAFVCCFLGFLVSLFGIREGLLQFRFLRENRPLGPGWYHENLIKKTGV